MIKRIPMIKEKLTVDEMIEHLITLYDLGIKRKWSMPSHMFKEKEKQDFENHIIESLLYDFGYKDQDIYDMIQKLDKDK